jgi:hypothetical protein
MAEKTLAEVLGTILIPIVGLIATGVAWLVNEEATQRTEALGYVHDLGDKADPAKQGIAVAMLTKLVTKQEFLDSLDGRAELRNDVVQMVQAVASTGSGEDIWQQDAAAVLAAYQKALAPNTGTVAYSLNVPAPKNSPTASTTTKPVSLSVPSGLGTTVYVQYAIPAQKDAAIALTQALQSQGYYAPGIQLVPASPSKTEVRFFSADGNYKSLAISLSNQLDACKLNSTLRDETSYPTASRQQLEIWLGKDDTTVLGLPDCLAANK